MTAGTAADRGGPDPGDGQQARAVADRNLVVAGYDGSAEAELAVRWAADLAQRDACTLRVVWAWQLRDVWDEALASRHGVAVPSLDELEDVARDRLAQVLDRLVGGRVPDIDIRLGRGPDSAGILLDAADDADVLVVGSRGHGRMAGALLGSVSTRCIQEAVCPVLVIPQRVTAAEDRVDSLRAEAEVPGRQPGG